MPIPKIKPDSIKSGVTRKLNAISLKVVKCRGAVETKFNASASKIPIATDHCKWSPIPASPGGSPAHAGANLPGSSGNCCIHRVHSGKAGATA